MKADGSVLIVDSDAENTRVLADALADDGWKVSTAWNGAQALAAVKAHPSLILLSVNLPIIGGLELCRLLKTNAGTRNIPVVVMIAPGAVREGIAALSAGAVDFIEKPFLRAKLPAVLETHLELERLRAGAEKAGTQQAPVLRRTLQSLQSQITGCRRLEISMLDNARLAAAALEAGRSYAVEWIPNTDELRRIPEAAGEEGSRSWSEFLRSVYPDDRETLTNRIAELSPSADRCDCDYRVNAPDGRVAYHHVEIRAHFEDDKAVRYVGLVRDTTRIGQPETALWENEERFRLVADTAPMMICASGPDMRATYFNHAWLAFAGRTLEEEMGYGWTTRLHRDDLDRTMASYSASFVARRKCHVEYRLRRVDGEYRWVVCSGVPRWSPDGVFGGYIASCVDITDLKRAQEEAFDKQKVESLRALTGGIAHDFNNLLGGILLQADMSESEIEEGVSPLSSIARIRKLATHASEIVRELLIYSGQDKATLEPINVSRVVAEMADLLKASISKHAQLETDLSADLPPILGNTTQIRQVVMNLILNASEAIGEKDGRIRVATSRNARQEQPTPAGERVRGDNYVRLQVEDTGRGMSKEARNKIFDPFYTTRSGGHGLGLAIVQGIVRAHGGEVNVNSTPGLGTTFEVMLPTLGDLAGRSPAPSREATPRRPPVRHGTILLVEEDDSFRISTGKALRRKGYPVLSSADCSAAVEVFRNHREDIGAVVVPADPDRFDGAELVEEIRRSGQSLAMIVTCQSDECSSGALEAFSGLDVTILKKPYRVEDLVARLQALAAST